MISFKFILVTIITYMVLHTSVSFVIMYLLSVLKDYLQSTQKDIKIAGLVCIIFVNKFSILR